MTMPVEGLEDRLLPLSPKNGCYHKTMAIRLSEILEHDAPHLSITNRKQLLAFCDALKTALKEGRLKPEGGALPTSLNDLLVLLPGEQPLAKRDRDLTDWSVENDPEYAAFLNTWRTRTATPPKSYKPRAVAAPLHQAVMHLQALRSDGSKKAELEGTVDTFLDVYALSQHSLKLPRLDRALPTSLPAGFALDAQKVGLGDDSKGTYVGLVQRRKGKEKQVSKNTP